MRKTMGFRQLLRISLAVFMTVMFLIPTFFKFRVVAASSDTSSYQAIKSGDFLKADGQNLTKANGNIVNLRGTNAGGYFIQELWMTPTASSSNVSDQTDIMEVLTNRFGESGMRELLDTYENAYWTEEDFKNIADMGLNCVRLPFWWRNLVDENGNWYGYDATASDPYKTAFARMDWFVETAGKYGIYVIIDFHGAPGSQNGSDHSGVDGGDNKLDASQFFFGDNAAKNQQLYLDMFKVIAARYAGNPIVAGYDLLNEPYCTYRYSSGYSASTLHTMLWTVYDNAYKTIREVDSDHLIIMEAVWDAADLPNPTTYGWTNVMYEYHNYTYSDYYNDNGTQISNMQSKIDGIRNANYNVPSYMGEFCYFSKIDTWNQGLELLDKAGINWTTWSYKTVASYGNWGLYHHPSNMNGGINLETASFDEIKAYWSNVTTSAGSANSELIKAVSAGAKASAYNFAGEEVIYSEEYDTSVITYSGWTHLEAEEASNRSGGKLIDDSNFTSGESFSNHSAVGGYGANRPRESFDGNWQNTEYIGYTITAPVAGTYTVVVTYDGDDDKEVYVGVDGEEPIKVSIPTQSTDKAWDKMHKVMFTVDLLEGSHTLYMSSPIWSEATKGAWLNYDCIDISNYPISLSEDGTYRYEAEYFNSTSTALQKASHYSNGQAWGSLNMNIGATDFATDWSNVKYTEYAVFVPEDGNYNIILGYDGNNTTGMELVYKINDDENTSLFIDGAGWGKAKTATFEASLTKGFNIIKISGTVGTYQNWANDDYIDIKKSGATETDTPIEEPVSPYTYQGNYLVLDGKLEFVFRVAFADGITPSQDNKIKFIINGETKEVSYSTINGNVADYTCALAASQLTENIDVWLYYEGEYQRLDSTSLKTYLETIIENKDNNASYAKAKKLAEALLNYGAYSQLYFDVNTDSLANASLDSDPVVNLKSETVAEQIKDEVKVVGSVSKLKFYGSSLVCNLNTSLKLYFTYTNGSDMEFVNENIAFTCDKNDTIVTGGNNKAMYIRLDEIAGPDLDEEVTFTVTDGENSLKVTESPLCYIKQAMLGNYDEKLVNLMKALYLYYLEADEYFS